MPGLANKGQLMRSFASRMADRRRLPVSNSGAERPPGNRPGSGLAVIGAGFGRTGTMSLKLALEQLGMGPCYHMTEIAKNPSHPRLWRAADAGDSVDWKKLFARYRAAVDWPACRYYCELMETFPDAKVILTVRDPAQWYNSMASTLYALKTATDRRLSALFRSSGTEGLTHLYENRIWSETFSGRFEDRQYAIEIFERHNAEVLAHVPRDRLLVYEISAGWQPLCGFLGVTSPDQPFPHANTSQSFRDYNRRGLELL